MDPYTFESDVLAGLAELYLEREDFDRALYYFEKSNERLQTLIDLVRADNATLERRLEWLLRPPGAA
jgi:hypothetical protein